MLRPGELHSSEVKSNLTSQRLLQTHTDGCGLCWRACIDDLSWKYSIIINAHIIQNDREILGYVTLFNYLCAWGTQIFSGLILFLLIHSGIWCEKLFRSSGAMINEPDDPGEQLINSVTCKGLLYHKVIISTKSSRVVIDKTLQWTLLSISFWALAPILVNKTAMYRHHGPSLRMCDDPAVCLCK